MQVACGYTIPITMFGLPPSPRDHLASLAIIGMAGFRQVELELYDSLIDAHRRDLPAMRQVLEEHGLTVPSVMAVEEGLFSLDPELRRAALADFDALTDLIAELRSPLVSVCGYVPPEIRPSGTELYIGGPPRAVRVPEWFRWSDFWANAVDVFGRCAEIARRKGLSLIIETRANDMFSSTDAVLNLIRESGAKSSGVILDVAHVHAGKEYLALVIPKLGELIKLVHLSDNDGSQAYHLPPGSGTIDFPAVLRDLKRADFDGSLVVDISGVPDVLNEAIHARDRFERMVEEIEA